MFFFTVAKAASEAAVTAVAEVYYLWSNKHNNLLKA